MNRDDIIRMAREADLIVSESVAELLDGEEIWLCGERGMQELERFAALVAAAEREACARICDAVQRKNEEDGAWLWEAKNCANAIRARGEV